MRTRHLLLATFLVCLGIVSLLPIWIVKYPPLVDYPNHLARAFILAHLQEFGRHFGQAYTSDWSLSPYLMMDAMLVGLQRVMSVELAGRLFFSLCVVSVPLAAWYFIRQASPGNDWLALWALLLNYDYFTLYGFLNMQLSIAACFVTLGLWLRYQSRQTTRRWFLALAAVTVLYFTHLMGFAVAGLIVLAFVLLQRKNWREIFVSGLLFVPGTAIYLWWRGHSGEKWPVEFRTLGEKIHAFPDFLRGYSDWLDLATLVMIAICCFAAWWRNRDFRLNRAWALVFVCLFALFWALPESYGVGWPVDTRIMPFAFVMLLAIVNVGRRARWLGAIAVFLFLARTANVAHSFRAEQPEMAGWARCIAETPANVRVLPVVEQLDDESYRRPYPHFWAYGVVTRGWFAPYILAGRGLMPLEVEMSAETPDGFWDLDYDGDPNWEKLKTQYNYVWAFNVERFGGDLNTIGAPVCASGDLMIYKLTKP